MSAIQVVVVAILGALALGLGILAWHWWPDDEVAGLDVAQGAQGDDEEDHEHTGRHHLGLEREVPVADLLAQAADAGEPLRLNWPDEALDDTGMVRPSYRDDLPTGFLPQIRD